MLKKTITVETSDPMRPRVQLRVSGMVDHFIRIAPQRLRLEGSAGAALKQTARIILTKKYPVRLLEAKAKDGSNIAVALEKIPGKTLQEYRLTVRSSRSEPGRFYDTVVIKTDSPLRPSISIGVFANITPAPGSPES